MMHTVLVQEVLQKANLFTRGRFVRGLEAVPAEGVATGAANSEWPLALDRLHRDLVVLDLLRERDAASAARARAPLDVRVAVHIRIEHLLLQPGVAAAHRPSCSQHPWLQKVRQSM